MTRTLGLALLLAVALTAGSQIHAKSLSKIVASAGLTSEDFDLLNATARTLYEAASPPVGRIVSWSNPDSGSHGTVRLAAMRGNCAYLQHFVYAKGQAQPRELRSQRCKAADGRWLLQP